MWFFSTSSKLYLFKPYLHIQLHRTFAPAKSTVCVPLKTLLRIGHQLKYSNEIVIEIDDPCFQNERRFSKGEMLISLLYQADHGRMILELLQIRPMPVLVSNNQDKEKGEKRNSKLYYVHQSCNSGTASKSVLPFCSVTIKVLLYERGYLISSRRTNSIRRDEATAVIREKFVFALQPQMLHEASCQLVLVTKSTIGTSFL